MNPDQIVEATLFASQSPLTAVELARADEGLTVGRVKKALQALRERYDEEEHAFQIYQLGDGFQVLTRPEYAPYLERFDSVPRPPVLSRAALETAAIIAYRQPIGRIEIEEIRGVASTSVLRTLQDWDLIEVVGRGEGLGRPLLYGTTKHFLDHFGLQDLRGLPRPEDLPVALQGVAPEEPVAESPESETAEVADSRPAAAEPRAESRTAAAGPPDDPTSGNGARPRANGSGPEAGGRRG